MTLPADRLISGEGQGHPHTITATSDQQLNSLSLEAANNGGT
jgi:hypothetical protein